MLGIKFNGLHSWKDFGITIKSKEIGSPSPILIKDSVPYMNGQYDFSKLYGEIAYDERTLKYTFNIFDISKRNMNLLKIKVINWLKTSEKSQLFDDAIVGYYFLAQCVDFDFKEDGAIGELTVEFKAYPFMFKNEYEGQILWDTFCFELDTLQETKFEVNGAKEIVLINAGSKSVIPKIICDSNFEIKLNNITFILNSGTTEDSSLNLDIGENKIVLIGVGTIEFKFRIEVL